MLKKVLCVVLALVLALGTMSVAAFAATAAEIEAAVAKLPSDYNAQFYNDKTVAAIQAAKAAAASGAANAVELCNAAYDLVTEIAYDAFDAPYYVNRDESKAVVNYNVSADTNKVKPGETFSVTVSMQSNFVIGVAMVALAYDKTALSIESVTHPASMDARLVYNDHNPAYMRANNPDYIPMEWLYEGEDGSTALDKYNLMSMIVTTNGTGAVQGVTPTWFPKDAAEEVFTVTFKVADNAADGAAKVFIDDTVRCSYFEYETDECFIEPLFYFGRGNHEHYLPETLVKNPDGATLKNGASPYDELAMWDQTVVYGAGENASVYSSTTYGDTEVDVDGVAIDVKIASTQPANYANLDKAVAEAANYSSNDWTPETYSKLADAVNAANECARNLTEEQQATVDALEAAIYEAIEGLKRQQAAGCPIVSITPKSEIRYMQYADLDVVVKDAPAMKVRFVDKDGNTITFTRETALTKGITDNGDGTETWNISLITFDLETEYSVYVRDMETGWNEVAYIYDMVAVDPDTLDGRFISFDIVDDYEGAVYHGINTVTVVTGIDVIKVQFVEKGNTWTFSGSDATYVDADGVRTWTLKMPFAKLGDHSFDIRTRTLKSSFTSTGVKMDVTVFAK